MIVLNACFHCYAQVTIHSFLILMRRVYVVSGVLPHIMRRVIFGITPTFAKHVPLMSHFDLNSGTAYVCWLLFFVPSGMRIYQGVSML